MGYHYERAGQNLCPAYSGLRLLLTRPPAMTNQDDLSGLLPSKFGARHHIDTI